MKMSRRRAVASLVFGGAIAAGGTLLRYRPGDLRELARGVRSRLPQVTLPPAAVGPLTPSALETLLALPEALVDRDVGTDRYRRFYEFRAERLTGYRRLYESFARDLARVSTSPFHALAPADRREALASLGLTPAMTTVVRAWLGGQRAARYDHFIVRETLLVFSATDAWLLAGYGAHPGQPRTLEHYLKPADMIV